MSFINPQTKEINCKIVYYGPPFSGKTTNLRELHKKVADKTAKIPATLTAGEDRTLYFDFLPLSMGKVKGYTVRFHLYTLPGQVQFDASRKIILKGTDGLVFVADSQVDRLERNVESWKDLQSNLENLKMDFKSVPLVVQLNKRDLEETIPVSSLREVFNGCECVEAVAVQGKGVAETLHAITREVLKDLKKG